MTTLTEVKDALLAAILVAVNEGVDEDLERLIGAYCALCQSETLCKCPAREDDEFAGDIQ